MAELPDHPLLLSATDVEQKFEEAFKPLRCEAEIWDYGDKLRFAVFQGDDNAKPILQAERVVLRHVRHKDDLLAIISAYREVIEDKGYRLHAWHP